MVPAKIFTPPFPPTLLLLIPTHFSDTLLGIREMDIEMKTPKKIGIVNGGGH
jgi:hypothetical protein